MSLPLTIPDQSTYRLFYNGPIGVAGVGVQQSWDLTVLPRRVREDLSFRDNFIVFIRQIDPGITYVDPAVEFFDDAEGLPSEIAITFNTDNTDNQIEIMFWYVHSVVR